MDITEFKSNWPTRSPTCVGSRFRGRQRRRGTRLACLAAVRRAEGRLFAGSSGNPMLQLAVYTMDGKVRHINMPAGDAADRLAGLLLADFAQLNISSARGEFEAKRAKDGSPVITRKLPAKKKRRRASSCRAYRHA